ncbi:MAG: hypothetical protein D6683_03855 [Actinomyces sp.]|nr:MAG: hypothetical protein D6683_03855 [Actinomyces sp.]
MNWWTEIRGLVAVGVVVVAMVVAWQRLDASDVSLATSATTSSTTTTASTTTTSTTTPEQAVEAACTRARRLVDEVDALGDDPPPGAVAALASSFWEDVLPLVPAELQTEVVAVVDYYHDYLELATPYEFDPVRIIGEGDKERYEQLVTRPAPGLATSRGFFAFVCGTELPEQPTLSSREFGRIEDRLFGDEDT